MSELFFANLSRTPDPGKMAYDARSHLTDFEDYLHRAKNHIESIVPLAKWEVEGEYHALSSISDSPDDIRKVLADKGAYELRFINEDEMPVQLAVRYTYVLELVIILDSRCEFKTARLTHYNEDDEVTVYDLTVNHIPGNNIGNSISLPHYRLAIEPVDDTEDGNQHHNKFFDDYTSEVKIVSDQLINTDGLKKAMRNSPSSKIKYQDSKNQCLHLTRIPNEDSILALRSNTYVIDRQLSAIRRLKNSPLEAHRPLIRLFEGERSATWLIGNYDDVHIDQFRFLQDGFSGVESQKEFVRRALGTPDFALLEGPPGSGKTAVITEIILQAIERGERVLLSASTHVAVDNVIERLKDEKNLLKDELLLVRIGDEAKVSGKTAKYTLENFVETELRALRKSLTARTDLTEWQLTLRDTLEQSQDEAEALIRRLILNSAQLICGTTIGILQHPEIREIKDDGRPVDPAFDMLILDEASKTTFSEFIVPALHAKKWIIVGDCRQLSPYVDVREIEVNVAASFDQILDDSIGSKSKWRDRCFKIYDGLRNAEQASVIIQIDDEEDRQRVIQQAVNASSYVQGDKSGLELVCDLSQFNSGSQIDRLQLSSSGVVIGTQDEISNHERFLPFHCIHLDEDSLNILFARNEAAESSSKSFTFTDESWEGAVTWRMKKEYEKRLFTLDENADANTLIKKLSPLMPSKHLLNEGESDASLNLLNVFKVGFPSVLESLQFGFGRGRKLKHGITSAITHGLPKYVLKHRHVALEYQHRMHPSISKYPRDSIYGGKLLLDAEGIGNKRSQFPEDQRVIWIDVPDGDESGRSKSNRREADAVIARVKYLQQLLSSNPHPEGGTWTVAVLTFYRGQERILRDRLKELTKHNRSPYKFGSLSIDLCTTDRFQGHEADVVILSYVRTRSAGFLDSPNRLNVAITRARYQMIHVGKRRFFRGSYIKKKAKLLHDLIESLPQEAFVTDIAKKGRKRS